MTGEFSVTERFFTSGIEISFPVTYQGVTESIPFEIELCKDEVESATWGIAGEATVNEGDVVTYTCLLYTSPSPRDRTRSRMPSSA